MATSRARGPSLERVLELYRTDRHAALLALIALLCPGPVAIDSARALASACSPSTPENAGAWLLMGELAFSGEFHAVDAEAWAMADLAYSRALEHLNATQSIWFQAMYGLASTREREGRYAEALDGYLSIVWTVDDLREQNPGADLGPRTSVRTMAVEQAALLVTYDRDWDHDNRLDPLRGLDRPEVKVLLTQRLLLPRSRADFYARLVTTALGRSSPRFPVVRACPLAARALAALRAVAPADARLAALAPDVAGCR